MEIITNSLESGDWVIVKNGCGHTLFAGHSIGPHDLYNIFAQMHTDIKPVIECTDEEIADYED